jgi:hypothetical protein
MNINNKKNFSILNFQCLSNDEKFFLIFDSMKSIGKVYSTYNYHNNSNPVTSFSLIGYSDQLYFSQDSEFIFILEITKSERILIVFSIREEKFVFRRKLKNSEIEKIKIYNKFVFCYINIKLFEVLEIDIPIRLKAYEILFPVDMYFNFK